jgi:hypothetical protein
MVGGGLDGSASPTSGPVEAQTCATVEGGNMGMEIGPQQDAQWAGHSSACQ